MEEYLGHEFARRAAAPPRDDLIGQLLDLEVDGQRLGHETVLNMVYQLTFAGLDTVTSSLSCMIAWLADHPSQRRDLVARPALIQPAVEELLRFLSPVPSTFRWPTQDITLPSGTTIPAGTQIHASWAAANLDPDAFPNPLQVDFDRPANAHIAFASGWHRCLGSHLARLELRVALEEFHKRIPDYSIAPRDQVRYSNISVRHVKPLPLVFTALPDGA
jgi:cytochrome P450